MKTNNLLLRYNHNSKLDCDCFTVIYPYDEQLFQPNNELELYLRDHPLGKVRVIQHHQLEESQITDWIAYVDAGYHAVHVRNMLRREYKIKREKVVYSWALLTYVRRYQIEDWLKGQPRVPTNKQLALGLAPS